MARAFTNAGSEYIDVSLTQPAFPFSFACWINSPSPSAGGSCCNFYNTSNNVDCLGFAIDAATSKVQGFIFDDGASFAVNMIGGPVLSADTWYPVVSVHVNAANRTLYIGGSATSMNDTTSIAYTGGQPQFEFSSFRRTFFSDIRLAEGAIWDIDLTAGEAASYCKGYSSLFIRPGNLFSYWPLIGRTSPEVDIVGGRGGTLTGTTVYPHPRIIMPSSQRMRRMTTTGGAATFPWAWAQGSNLPVLGTGNY